MVARSGSYFGAPFKGHCGVTHGEPLSRSIHVPLSLGLSGSRGGGEAAPEGLGQDVQWIEAYFYADDGLLTSTREVIIQREFNIM